MTSNPQRWYGSDTILRAMQIVLLVVIVLYVHKLNKRIDKLNKKIVDVSAKAAPAALVNLNFDKTSPQIGADDAKVVMTIFSDFECEFCRSFANEVFPRLKADYIDKGLLKVYFRFLPLDIHKNAHVAAEAAAYANDHGKFWDMHDRLFKQTSLNSNVIASCIAGNGLDTAQLNKHIKEHTYKNKIDNDISEANRAGITGTPAIVINGNVTMGSRPYGHFTDLIDKELADASVM